LIFYDDINKPYQNVDSFTNRKGIRVSMGIDEDTSTTVVPLVRIALRTQWDLLNNISKVVLRFNLRLQKKIK